MFKKKKKCGVECVGKKKLVTLQKMKQVSREAGLGTSAKTTQKGTLIFYLVYWSKNNFLGLLKSIHKETQIDSGKMLASSKNKNQKENHKPVSNQHNQSLGT